MFTPRCPIWVTWCKLLCKAPPPPRAPTNTKGHPPMNPIFAPIIAAQITTATTAIIILTLTLLAFRATQTPPAKKALNWFFTAPNHKN